MTQQHDPLFEFDERERWRERFDSVELKGTGIMQTLRAFHGDPAIQQKYIDRVKQHAALDEIMQGFYWEDGKGCAVGCTIHGRDHEAYESELGIPTALAYLQDRIFEGLPNADAKQFPLQFLEAIPLSADLSTVTAHFLVWLLEDEAYGVIRFADDQGEAAIAQVVALYKRRLAGDEPTKEEWEAAAYAAAYAADAAARAAAYAAYAAADAAADAAARAAAYAAAYAAARAAADAAYAARAARAAADAAARAARAAMYQAMRDKLLELLASAPVLEAA